MMDIPLKQIIGIVGGVGPFAGVDFAKKILDKTIAKSDQDHLSFIMISMPSSITDRTEFILGKCEENPGKKIGEIVLSLEKAGCSFAAIPCNTSHAPTIFSLIEKTLEVNKSKIILLNMITEICTEIKSSYEKIKNVGILATTGTVKSRLYDNYLLAENLTPVYPNDKIQNTVQEAIYNTKWGIKSGNIFNNTRAKDILLSAIDHLAENGAHIVVLACTEIPLTIDCCSYHEVPLIDSTDVLAGACIRKINPSLLKPKNVYE